jgi:hypothetical protein
MLLAQQFIYRQTAHIFADARTIILVLFYQKILFKNTNERLSEFIELNTQSLQITLSAVASYGFGFTFRSIDQYTQILLVLLVN